MRGHLLFDAYFEGGGAKSLPEQHSMILLSYMIILCTGNLGRVDYINDYEYDVFIRPDTCNPRYRLDELNNALPCTDPHTCIILTSLECGMFHFSVQNVRSEQVLVLLLLFD